MFRPLTSNLQPPKAHASNRQPLTSNFLLLMLMRVGAVGVGVDMLVHVKFVV